MKTTIKTTVASGLLLLAICLFPFSVHAVPILVVGNLVTVNNTSSNSAPFVALGSTPGSQTLNVTHGVLTATNAFYLSAQFTMDQTNYWTSPTLWYPSNTNACTEYVSATYWSFQPYMRLVCTSTNSIQYQATYGQ